MNDNEMSDPQRIKVLEAAVVRMRKDLARVTTMLGHTPRGTRLISQKGAIEKVISQAQVEIAKLRKRAK
jgi:phage shock protein A